MYLGDGRQRYGASRTFPSAEPQASLWRESPLLRRVTTWTAVSVAGIAGLGILSNLATPKPDRSDSDKNGRWVNKDKPSGGLNFDGYWTGIGDPKTGTEILPPDVLGLKSPEMKEKATTAAWLLGRFQSRLTA